MYLNNDSRVLHVRVFRPMIPVPFILIIYVYMNDISH